MTVDDDIRRHSVTRDDVVATTRGAVPLTVVVGPADLRWGGLLEGVQGANGLPRYGSRARDQILADSTLIENMWAAAVGLAISKQAAIGWTVEDDAQSDIRIKRAQDLLLAFDGGYVAGLSRHLRDYLLTNNGAFVEIVRASNARGSRVLGLMHLDSLRCWRTADPAYPVLYQSRYGELHRLPAENVIALADLPSARADAYGYGQCAADRAWSTIMQRAAVETYVREKVTGTRNLALHFITNVNADRLREALNATEADQAQRGFVLYRGSTIVPMLGGGGGETPTLITIPLAEIPDGFDIDLARHAANQLYANALGIPVQDIEPLSGQGLGTGTQTVILAEAAQGHGLAAWRRAWQQAVTHRVLPASTTFAFAGNDIRDRQARAGVLAQVAGAVGGLVAQGILRPDQALNVLVDEGVIDRAYLPQDVTPGAVLADTDKPLGAEADATNATAAAPAALPTPGAPLIGSKARRDVPEPADDAIVDALIDAELAEALVWARRVAGDAE